MREKIQKFIEIKNKKFTKVEEDGKRDLITKYKHKNTTLFIKGIKSTPVLCVNGERLNLSIDEIEELRKKYKSINDFYIEKDQVGLLEDLEL